MLASSRAPVEVAVIFFTLVLEPHLLDPVPSSPWVTTGRSCTAAAGNEGDGAFLFRVTATHSFVRVLVAYNPSTTVLILLKQNE